MPIYCFWDTITNRHWEESFKIKEMEKYLKDNPHIHIEILYPNPTLCPIRLGIKKPDNLFRERLRKIKKENKGSTINDR